ncbi:MAG: phage minor head protein [Rikenellaceae bacterium]
MREASTLLLTPEGNVKPFYLFKNDVTAINSKYNVNYLRAEYDFAVSSSQMAARWEASDDDDEGILLQYRTAKDDHVRAEHRPLDGITLPKKDSFWNSYYPPNDWGCRCTVVEVLADDYPTSDADEAAAIGNRALSVKGVKSEIFKFNPGKEEKIFPPKHSYFPKCSDCKLKGKVSLTVRDSRLPQCGACGEIFKQCAKKTEIKLKEWRDKTIPNRGLSLKGKNFASGELLVTRGSVKDIVGHTENLKVLTSLFDIEKDAKNYKYIGWGECHVSKKTGKRKHPEAEYFLYYEMDIKGEKFYANVKAHKHFNREVLYCIRQKCNTQGLNKGLPANIDRYKRK